MRDPASMLSRALPTAMQPKAAKAMNHESTAVAQMSCENFALQLLPMPCHEK